MQEPIKVLLVEDNPADARLLAESLKESGPDAFRVTHVTRLGAAVEVIGHTPADVILLDLSLPDSQGLGTVDRLQAAAPGVAIVVLTGLQDEALALQAVRQGVQDYLVKGQCEGELTARALRYAVERRRADAALQESEERFRALSDATFDALILHENGRVIEVNQAFARMFGYAADEVIGKDVTEMTVAPESLPLLAEQIRSGSERPYEVVLRRKDGTTFPAEIRAKNTLYRGRSVRVASVHDVAERKAAEEATRSAERQLRTISDAVPALISYVDQGGRYRLNNAAYERWFGVSRDAVAGRHMKEVLGEAAWEKVRPRVERALAGDDVRFDDLVPYSGGGPRWVSISYTPSRGPAGDVQGIVVLVNDISERKRAEDAVRESEARFRTLADGAPVLIWVNGPDGAEFVNRTYIEFLGVDSDVDVRGYDWAQFIHPDDREAYVNAYLDCLARRAEFTAQFRFRHRDGVYHWMTSSGRPRFTAAGDFLGYVGSTVDISDIKRAEGALRDREARLRAVVETAVDAIITIDERGTIDSLNPATERLFGYGRDELVGRNVSLLMPEPYRGEHDSYADRYLRTGEARIIGIGREVVGLRKDGSTFPLDLSVSEFRIGDRRMFTGILHDITNRRRLEREILEASANEQRRIGHELHDGLCQQLTGISFSAEILARKLEGRTPDAVPHVRKLADEVDQAITQTRTLARGLNPVEIHADSLAPALEDLASKVSESFGVSCRFSHKGEGEVAAPDNTAATHLYRIAQEAISNAIRHGGAKEIEVKLQAEGGSLSLSVTDDGKGFDPHDGAAAPREKPAGIGLQTMSYRAKMISGILDVRPRPRRGVIVTCSIPRGNGLVLR